MTMTITATTLCICRHIRSMHNQDADCVLCRCTGFLATSRSSSSHYRRGQRTTRKRVARLDEDDRILVAFTPDGQLHPAEAKTGALVASVTHPPARHPEGWQITTNLGDLPVLFGSHAVHVLAEALPW